MQVFVPYSDPLLVAQCLDKRRLNKAIIECNQILNAIEGIGKGWFNHPICKMYTGHIEWLTFYKRCLSSYWAYLNATDEDMKAEYIYDAMIMSKYANYITPSFLTEEFCDQHKRRLYTKDKEHYKQFAQYGESEENWYYLNNEIVKYINGKRL